MFTPVTITSLPSMDMLYLGESSNSKGFVEMKYVYMLKVGDKHYKVGVALNVQSRVKDLQTSNPNVIEVVTTKLVEETYKIEGSLHDYLVQMKADGGREWFVLTPEQAIALAILINKQPAVDISQQITLRTILAEQTKRQVSLEQKVDTVYKKLRNIPLDKETIETVKKIQEDKDRPDERLDDDLLMQDALKVIHTEERASTSLLQRKLRIGYGRAARLIEELEEQGVIGAADGSRAREVIKTE